MDKSKFLKHFEDVLASVESNQFPTDKQQSCANKNAELLTKGDSTTEPASSKSRRKSRTTFFSELRKELGMDAFLLCAFALQPSVFPSMKLSEFATAFDGWSSRNPIPQSFRSVAEQWFNSAVTKRVIAAPNHKSSDSAEPPASEEQPSNRGDHRSLKRHRSDTGDGVRFMSIQRILQSDAEVDYVKNSTEPGDFNKAHKAGYEKPDTGEAEKAHEADEVKDNDSGEDSGDGDDGDDDDEILPDSKADIHGGGATAEDVSLVDMDQMVYRLETMDISRMAHLLGAVGVVRLTIPKDRGIKPFVIYSCTRKVAYQFMKHRTREQ